MKHFFSALILLLSFQSMAKADGITCSNGMGADISVKLDDDNNVVGRLHYMYNKASFVCDGPALDRIKETGSTKCIGMWFQGIDRRTESKEISFEVKFSTNSKKELTVSFPNNYDQRTHGKIEVVSVKCD